MAGVYRVGEIQGVVMGGVVLVDDRGSPKVVLQVGMVLVDDRGSPKVVQLVGVVHHDVFGKMLFESNGLQ